MLGIDVFADNLGAKTLTAGLGKHAWRLTRPHPLDSQTMYLQALLLLLCWLTRTTTPHDWTAPTWDQTLAEYLGHDTGHGQPRLSLASRPGNAWSRDPLVHQRQGFWRCWWLVGLPNTETLGSLLLPALRQVHAAAGRTGAARLPAPSVNQRNF